MHGGFDGKDLKYRQRLGFKRVTMEGVSPKEQAKYPYFQKGVLRFEKSDHALTTNGQYYVCSNKQKGQCALPEKRIRKDNLERNFARLAKTFEVPKSQKLPLIKHAFGEMLHTEVDNMLEEIDLQEVVADMSIDLMKQDIENGDMHQFEQDATDAATAIETHNNRDSSTVAGFLSGMLVVFARDDVSEADMGRTLAYLSEKVYISGDGKILKIKLHAIGDYLFQYIKDYCPNYSEPFKYFIDQEHFNSLRYKDVSKKIRDEELGAIMIPQIAIGASAISLATQSIFNFIDNTPEKALDLLNFAQNSIIGRLSVGLNKTIKRRRDSKTTSE